MNVFIIEDSPTISLILEKTLSSYGYIPFSYSSTTYTPALLNDHRYEFFIVDTNLINIESSSICSQIRKRQNMSYIIGITHRGSWTDRIDFLNSGADDCLSYPFPPEEILARMQALLRRPKNRIAVSLTYGKFKINPNIRQAYYDKTKLLLSKKEYNLLEYLLRNSERSISRYELMDHIWDYRKSTSSNTVDVHITRLRKKISSTRNKSYKNSDNFESEIKTVYGIGYKMEDNFSEKAKTSLSS